MLIVTLSNFAPPGSNINPSRVQVSVGGVSRSVLTVAQFGASLYQVTFRSEFENETVGQSEPLIVLSPTGAQQLTPYPPRMSYPQRIVHPPRTLNHQ